MRVDTTTSFVYFVYPFIFEAGDFAATVKTVDSAEWPGRDGKALKIWQKQNFPQDDLLPQVSRYLNPDETREPTARMWHLSSEALQSPRGLGGGGKSPQVDWSLLLAQRASDTAPRRIPLRIEGVRLVLFRVGVGFITVCAEPTTPELGDWLDFVHHFRFLSGRRARKVRAQRRSGEQRETAAFFPDCTGGTAQHPAGEGGFGEIVDALLRTASPAAAPWWEEVFVPDQMLPFVALFVEEVPEDVTPMLLYRLRNFFNSQQEIVPGPEDLTLGHPALLPYTNRQWFQVSLDGAAFLAVDAPATEFFTRTLPGHLRDHYFLIFLLALQQRFTLTKLTQEVSEHWLEGTERERVGHFKRIRDTLLEFTARGYFTQVMQREHHHRWYRKCQETFQVERLYNEVSDEVRDMHEYLLMRQNERLERRISMLGVLIGIPALTIGFLGINLIGFTTSTDGLRWWQALAFILGVSALVWPMMLWPMLRRH
jgi:hypothetical protein